MHKRSWTWQEHIYKKQLDKFATIQDSQGMRRAYPAETAELAYNGSMKRVSGDWQWGAGPKLNDQHHSRYEIHPALQGNWPVHLLHLAVAHGLGCTVIEHNHIPEGDNHFEVQRI
jgi:hypothetical protein